MTAIKYSSIDHAADEIIRRTSGNVILGAPLGLGKPNQLLNALYQKIKNKPEYSLTIYTALSLSRPGLAGKGELERRFLQPFIGRVFGDYQELDYLQAARHGTLPKNIHVHEFFFQPGAELNNQYAQQQYLSSNYTHVARDLNALGVNVVAQLVAEENGLYSLSCNPEITLDLYPLLQARKAGGETILCVGQVHHDLPFMGNSAQVKADAFDLVIDDPSAQTTLMSTPNMPVGMVEHLIGINASALIKDGGTLQIGIGALGDAITYALLLRQQSNHTYQKILADLDFFSRFKEEILSTEELGTFRQGLYSCSEMLTYGLLRLFVEGVIKREVQDTRHSPDARICLHGGFFLGPKAFYDELSGLSQAQKSKIDMTGIGFVNHLYGNETLKRQHRQHACFINTAFTITLMGAIVSDQLEDGRVLSGVGGQYNFVAQAHELEGARSIILLRATRDTTKGVQSNIVWHYGHTTVPRHLRDMVVTEYGVADLRGKSDSEVIMAMLNVTDSRFQLSLLEEAKSHGKIAKNYQIPECFKNNSPEKLKTVFDLYFKKAFFPEFPLGSDFTLVEQDLLKAMAWLKINVKPKSILLLLKYMFPGANPDYYDHLQRMQLVHPLTVTEKLYRILLVAGLNATKLS